MTAPLAVDPAPRRAHACPVCGQTLHPTSQGEDRCARLQEAVETVRARVQTAAYVADEEAELR